jgi:uncharacterized protein (TIGR02145 family)
MKAFSLSRPIPLVERACYVSHNHLNMLPVFVALALCVTTVASARGPESTYPVQVDSGWNLLSLPVSISNGDIGVLFPSASSPAFRFHDPFGYEEQDTLHNGVGFWLKFNSLETLPIAGELVFKDTVEVHADWNIVGCLSAPIAVDSITTEPPGIIASQFFGYRPGVGYEEADTLYPGFGYWVKANQGGSIILSSSDGWPCPGIPTVFYAGKTYNTVQIGTQCWLRENLDVGTMVLGSQGQTDNDTIEKYCYDDNPVNCATYGGLYQWNEAMQYDTIQGVQGICPPGWHMPTSVEFETLSATVGGDGNALKAIGQGAGAGAGTNTSGFSALLAGYRDSGGGFSSLGGSAGLWSSTQLDAIVAHYLYLSYDDPTINVYYTITYKGFGVRCILGEGANLPPDAPSNPSPSDSSAGQSPSVILGWSCSDPDGDPLTYDVYFGTVNPPDTMVSSNQTGTTLGTSGLFGGTIYYWRAVSKDDSGHSTSGPIWSFTTGLVGGSPCPGTPTVPYGGKMYNTVQIGSQCWLRENLDVGTMVLGSQEQTDNDIVEKYCYDNNPVNCAAYGGFYQWDEAMQYDTTQAVQGVCPPGWHIPTFLEFGTLSATVGYDGNALKAIGQGAGAGAGANTSGFSALLAGYRMYDGPFGSLGNWAFLWSSTQTGATGARITQLSDYDHNVGLESGYRYNGFSVRCLKE